MKKIKLILTIILLISTIGLGSMLYHHLKNTVETKHEMKYTEVRQPEDFQVQSRDGTIVRLSDFKDGKPIVINFWSHKCSPCVQEMPTFQGLYEAYKNEVHFLLISTYKDLSSTEQFVSSYQYTVPIYHDMSYEAVKSLGVPSLPTTYIIDQNFNVIRGGKGIVTYPMITQVLDELLMAD